MLPVALKVVNAPALGVVMPMGKFIEPVAELIAVSSASVDIDPVKPANEVTPVFVNNKLSPYVAWLSSTTMLTPVPDRNLNELDAVFAVVLVPKLSVKLE